MSAENARQQTPQTSLSIEIDYDKSIRSIDLENTLSGFRMILQHELSSRTGMSPRSFTDVAQIESIEKGSIIVNMLFDLVNINASLADINIHLMSIDIDLIDIVLLYLAAPNLKERKDKLNVYIEGIKSALKRVKSIKLIAKDKTVELKSSQDGDITVSDIARKH